MNQREAGEKRTERGDDIVENREKPEMLLILRRRRRWRRDNWGRFHSATERRDSLRTARQDWTFFAGDNWNIIGKPPDGLDAKKR